MGCLGHIEYPGKWHDSQMAEEHKAALRWHGHWEDIPKAHMYWIELRNL